MILRSLVTIVTFVFSGMAAGECIRYKPPSPGSVPTGFDGPGSFGELQDTVTLDCLQYVGSIQREGIAHALIRDETGKLYDVKIGEVIGENAGVIRRIEADGIYLEQLFYRNGEWKVVAVRLPKR